MTEGIHLKLRSDEGTQDHETRNDLAGLVNKASGIGLHLARDLLRWETLVEEDKEGRKRQEGLGE